MKAIHRKNLNVPRLAVAFARTPAIKALAKKLEEFTHHHGWCEAKDGEGDTCECGLWALWQEFATENGDGRTVNLTFKLHEPTTPDIFAGRVVEACARYSTIKEGEGVVLPSDPTQKLVTDGKIAREEVDRLLIATGMATARELAIGKALEDITPSQLEYAIASCNYPEIAEKLSALRSAMTVPPARYDEANPRGCRANGTAMHLRCNDCDYCHTHAPEMASAAHVELEAM
jgi:hypothetical protein